MISFDKEKTRNLWFDNVRRIYASTLSEASYIDVTLPEGNRPVSASSTIPRVKLFSWFCSRKDLHFLRDLLLFT